MKTFGLRTNFPEEYSEESIVKVEFMATQECNLKCPWCVHGKVGTQLMIKPELPLRLDLVNDWMATPNHKFTICFTGGEPLIPSGKEGILNILDQILPGHLERLYRLEILTNGTQYDDEFFDKMEAICPDFILHIGHKKTCFKWDSVEVVELQKMVDRFGKRAVFFPVITMQNYKDFGKLMKRTYDMGFRTFNVRYDMMPQYPYKFFEAMDKAFSELPKDYVYIQSHNQCRVNFYAGWRKQYGEMNPICVSAAPRSELNIDVTRVQTFFEKFENASTEYRIKRSNEIPNRELIAAYFALKNNITMISNQHSKRWYTDED